MKERMQASAYIAFVFIAAACLLPIASSAQEQVISLNKALEIAYQNNADYKIALTEQKQAREKVNETWSVLFPVIESEAALIRQHADMGFMSLSDGQYDIKVVQVRVGVNPGAFYNSLEASKKGYKAATENVRKIKNNIAYNVIKSYFRVILSKEMIDLRKSAIGFLRENLKNVESLFKSGSAPKYDLLQAKVKLQSQEPNLIEAENNHRLSVDMFNFHLGAEGVRYTADREALNAPDEPESRDKSDERIAKLTGTAMKNRPEILLLSLKKQAAEEKMDLHESYYIWPTFSIGGYYGYNKNLVSEDVKNPLMTQVIGDNSWQANWQVRIAATYRWGSLFPVDTNKVHAREEELSVKKAEVELIRLKRAISISIKSSYYTLITSYDKIVSQRKNMETAEEGLRIAKESYGAGIIKNSDLLAAQLELTRAKTQYINSVNTYYLSLARLKKETGIDDDRIIVKGYGYE